MSVNFNDELGKRFGIYSGQHTPETVEHIISNGTDVIYEAWKKDIRSQIDSLSFITPKLSDTLFSIAMEEREYMSDEAAYDYTAQDGTIYHMDTDGDVMIFSSDWVTCCRGCSPCVPGAGNLDEPSDTGEETLCPPPEVMQELSNNNEESYTLRNLKTSETISIIPLSERIPMVPKHGYSNMPQTTLADAALKIGTDPKDDTKATRVYYHGFAVLWISGREDGAYNFALENGAFVVNADGNTTVGIETTTVH